MKQIGCKKLEESLGVRSENLWHHKTLHFSIHFWGELVVLLAADKLPVDSASNGIISRTTDLLRKFHV